MCENRWYVRKTQAIATVPRHKWLKHSGIEWFVKCQVNQRCFRSFPSSLLSHRSAIAAMWCVLGESSRERGLVLMYQGYAFLHIAGRGFKTHDVGLREFLYWLRPHSSWVKWSLKFCPSSVVRNSVLCIHPYESTRIIASLAATPKKSCD